MNKLSQKLTMAGFIGFTAFIFADMGFKLTAANNCNKYYEYNNLRTESIADKNFLEAERFSKLSKEYGELCIKGGVINRIMNYLEN